MLPLRVNYPDIGQKGLGLLIEACRRNIISQERNVGVAREFLAGLGEGKEPAVIAGLFSETTVFEIPGDSGAPPWIGRKVGRKVVADFIRDLRSLTEPVKFDVQEILVSDVRAAIVGELVTRIKATGKVI